MIRQLVSNNFLCIFLWKTVKSTIFFKINENSFFISCQFNKILSNFDQAKKRRSASRCNLFLAQNDGDASQFPESLSHASFELSGLSEKSLHPCLKLSGRPESLLHQCRRLSGTTERLSHICFELSG